MEKLILAMVGMAGSGKSTCVERLTSIGIPSVYFGGIVVDETKRRNGGVTSEAMERQVREEFREKDGKAALAKRIITQADALLETHDKLILDGLYSWSEYKVLRDHYGDSFKVIAIVAERDLRYQRLEKRPVRPLSKEEAMSRDTAEIENLEKGGPIAIANFTMLNNDTQDKLLEEFDVLMKRLGFLL